MARVFNGAFCNGNCRHQVKINRLIYRFQKYFPLTPASFHHCIPATAFYFADMIRWLLLLTLLQPLLSTAQTYERYSILITEFLADPTPSVGLPEYEFVELTNTSNTTIDLRLWTLSDESGSSLIRNSYLLPPEKSVIICPAAAASHYAAFGDVLGITGFPSLNNDADQLILRDPSGQVIHALSYTVDWYSNGLKSAGGWSLEMTDTRNPCGGASNWSASTDPTGGSPGRSNPTARENPDHQPPALTGAYVADSMTLLLYFDEPVSIKGLSPQVKLSDYPGSSLSIQSLEPFHNRVEVGLSKALDRKTIYTISVTGFRDCAGNPAGLSNTIRAGLAEMPSAGEVLINEILFNPRSGGADYVEILHAGSSAFNLADLYLSNGTATYARLSEHARLFFPGDYIALTSDPKNIAQEYTIRFDGSLLQVGKLPVFADDQGHVLISDQQGNVLDALRYTEKMHSPWIKDANGVALERIDPALPANRPDNWSSASSTAGYGTPGYRNSQYGTSASASAELSIEPAVFSPNGDGINDFTRISYAFEESGWHGMLELFSAAGQKVTDLMPNAVLGRSGAVIWNGMDVQGKRIKNGLYVIILKAYHTSGRTLKKMQALVISAQ